MARAKPAIIAYDVVCNKRRKKVQRMLRQWRLQGQYSLIECCLTIREAEDLLAGVTQLMNEREDKLLLAWLDSRIPVAGLGKAVIGLSNKPRLWN